MSERPTDHAWEALVEATTANVAQERGALNRALSIVRAATSDLGLSDEELASLIHEKADLYREVFTEMPLTPNALAKWWGRLDEEAQRLRALEAEKAEKLERERKTKGQNLSALSGCTTCEGQSWVVVGYRRPTQTAWMAEHKIQPTKHPSDRGMEEVAPCPVCNPDPPVMRNYWDGRSWDYSAEAGVLVVP